MEWVLCIARLSKQPRAKYQCSRNDTTRKQRWVQIPKLNHHIFQHQSLMSFSSGIRNVNGFEVHFDSITRSHQLLVFSYTRPFFIFVFVFRFVRSYHFHLSTLFGVCIRSAIALLHGAHSDSIRQLLTPPLDAVPFSHCICCTLGMIMYCLNVPLKWIQLNGWHGMALHCIIRLCSQQVYNKPQWTYTRVLQSKNHFSSFHSAFPTSSFAISNTHTHKQSNPNKCPCSCESIAPWNVWILFDFAVGVAGASAAVVAASATAVWVYAKTLKCFCTRYTYTEFFVLFFIFYGDKFCGWNRVNWFSTTPCSGRSLQSSVQYKTGICVYPTWKLRLRFVDNFSGKDTKNRLNFVYEKQHHHSIHRVQ